MSVKIRFQPGLKPIIQKHETHDQSTHGSWAGTKNELSDDDYKDIVYNAKTVEQAYTTIATRLGKNMKAKEAELSEDEINVYRGVTNVERDTKRLLDGKIRFQEFQTWGQGIYVDPTKERASDYGTVLSLKLDKNAKILKGEAKWNEAVNVRWQNENARVPNSWTSDFVDMNRIKMNINDMGYPNYSVSDLKNLYWASKGYDGFSPHGGEMVLFNGGVLTLNKNKIQKHQQHDQSTHGNWAGGGSSTLDEMPYKWKPKLDKVEPFKWFQTSSVDEETEKKERQKAVEIFQKVAEEPVSIRTYPQDFEDIVRDGGFRTFQELISEEVDGRITDAGGFYWRGKKYLEGRNELEHGKWGVPEDQGVIYGYMDTNYQEHVPDVEGYGGIKITLKDFVKGRTTFTAGDSLNNKRVPVLVKDALRGDLGEDVLMSAGGKYFKEPKDEKGAFRRGNLWYLTNAKNTSYFEAQVHGGVKLKDIKSVTKSKEYRLAPELLQILKDNDIEVIG